MKLLCADEGRHAEAIRALLVGKTIAAVAMDQRPNDVNEWCDVALTFTDGTVVKMEATGYDAESIRMWAARSQVDQER